ncbi:hypothetical protein ACHAXR_010225 [Thalassiosira sp. AJA248-18]
MEQTTSPTTDKKRRLNEMEANGGGSGNNNDNNDTSRAAVAGPIIFLNVGGAKRNVRRSLLNALRDASCTTTTTTHGEMGGVAGADDGLGSVCNPLCDVLLAEHWSDVPTTTDADGTVRIYIDRNPQAFDDLLEYIEYGKSFLEEIVNENGGSPGGARLRRLRLEAGYFTVGVFSTDIDDVMFGDPISFRSDSWFTIAGRCERNAAGRVAGWRWANVSGSESVATRHDEGLGICKVQKSGTFLVFFSLHSVAAMALAPGQGYRDESNDEFCTLSIFHENMTKSKDGHWTYPIMRVGAFNYHEGTEALAENPLLFTAACGEPLSLRKGNLLYCEHSSGVCSPAGQTTDGLVARHSNVNDIPHSVKYITLVQAFGDNISKWNVQHGEDLKDEPHIVKWTAGNHDFPSPNGSSISHAILDDKDDTKIRFKKEGHYLLLGRVAARLKKRDFEDDENPSIQLELCTKGSLPLHTIPDLVSFGVGHEDETYNKKLCEYGPINDIIYAEQDSYVCVKAKQGACFTGHGSVPDPIGRIPTQSLTAMRLKPSMWVDRYQISLYNGRIRFERARRYDEKLLEQPPLFSVETDMSEDHIMNALVDCQCVIVGCLCSLIGSNASLLNNEATIVHSQVCKGSGRGSHSFQAILELKKGDCLELHFGGDNSDYCDGGPNVGHLAFAVLDR